MAPKKRAVALILEGSRGDQQPYIVAALALKEAGYDVLILGTSDGEGMAKQKGLPFRSVGLCAKEVMQRSEMVEAVTENDYAKISAAVNATKALRGREILEIVTKELRTFQPGLIISSGMSLNLCIFLGKGLRIPVILMALQVVVPSNYIPALGVLPRLPSFLNLNWLAWKYVLDLLRKEGMKTSLPQLAELLQLPEEELQISFDEICDHCSCRPRFPLLFAVSSVFYGRFPPDFNDRCRPLGALSFRPDQQVGIDFGTTLELQKLKDFLQKCKASNERPIYMGFGSMICESSKFMTLLCLRALMTCRRPGVILSGWAELSLKDVEGEADSAELQAFCRDKVIFLTSAPHGEVFPQCAVLVHHGGAGTMYSAAVSGVPSVVLPILLDQYIHAELVNQRGIGIGLKSMRFASVQQLSTAITACLERPEIQQKAAMLSRQLAKEDGVKEVVKEVNQFFADFVDTGRYFEEKEKSKADSQRGILHCLARCLCNWGCCSLCRA